MRNFGGDCWRVSTVPNCRGATFKNSKLFGFDFVFPIAEEVEQSTLGLALSYISILKPIPNLHSSQTILDIVGMMI